MNNIPPVKRTGAGFNRAGSKQDYATPPDFMAAVARRFGKINFDLAAHAENTKHPNFFSLEDDSLRQEWHMIPGWLWLNPPFDKIEPWAAKCHDASARGAKILFLTPASVGSNWFRDHVKMHAFVLSLNGRIHFDPTNPTWGYPKDCMLSVYAYGFHGFDSWTWK